MTVLKSIAMAFSMFSRIPMPKIEWDPKSMRYMMAAFPLVGVVIGLLLWLWMFICNICGFGDALSAAGITLIPVLVTGGFHIDGLADTIDALASHAEPERKREILKDSHIGAFAGIAIAAYLIAYFAFATELRTDGIAILATCLVPVISRTMSGFVGTVFPGYDSPGLLHTFRESSKKRGTLVTLSVFLAVCIVLLFVFLPWQFGTLMIVAVLICTVYMYHMNRRQFGGMSGDLSGFYLQIVELAFIIALVIVERVILG